MYVYDTILTHWRPHWDEMVAIYLLRRHGETTFPGISTAKVEYIRDGERTGYPSPEECEAIGILPIAVLGGRFDEHPGEESRKVGECAATLVAKALNLHDDPLYRDLLQYTADHDLKGKTTGDFVKVVNLLHTYYPERPEKVMSLVFMAIDTVLNARESGVFEGWHCNDLAKWGAPESLIAELANAEAYLEAHRAEALKDIEAGQRLIVRTRRGNAVTVLVINSDNEQVAYKARSPAVDAGIVILQNSRGNVLLFANGSLTLREVARRVKQAEQEANGAQTTLDRGVLQSENRLEGAEIWHYVPHMRILLNGGLTAPNTAPTRIPLESIVTNVCDALRKGQAGEPSIWRGPSRVAHDAQTESQPASLATLGDLNPALAALLEKLAKQEEACQTS